MITLHTPPTIKNTCYEASLSISSSILPLEIVQKISAYMCQGTKIQFKRVSNICHKVILSLEDNQFSYEEREISYRAKFFFSFTDNTPNTDRIWGFEFGIKHGYCSFDKAKYCVDQIFSKYKNFYMVDVHLGAFYGRLGLERFKQCDYLNAEGALCESFRARPEGGSMALDLGRALYIHYYRRNELDQCARIKINFPKLYFSKEEFAKVIKSIPNFSF